MTDAFSGLSLSVDKPARMPLYHPITQQPLRSSDGQEAWVEVLMPESAAGREFERRTIEKRLSRRQGVKVTPEEIEQAAIDRLAVLTTGWSLVGLSGQAIDVPFSNEAARQLYANPACTWLRDQVVEFLGNRSSFAPAAE